MSYFPRRGEKRLIRAAEDGRLALVQSLLQAGASPNAKSEGDVTVLMWAAARGHLDVVKVLLESGAEPNARTRKGRTAIDIATQEGHNEVAALLLENSEPEIRHAESG
jgi:serine/threonine-protein phosphatase 6 regulatory ankyrin repeat subunit B